MGEAKKIYFTCLNFHFCLTHFVTQIDKMADTQPKKRTFRKYTYRGVDLDQLLDMTTDQLMELFPCRIRRKLTRGLKRKPMGLIKKLRKSKKNCLPNEKPEAVKTHLGDMIIMPEMVGSVVGVYQAKPLIRLKSSP